MGFSWGFSAWRMMLTTKSKPKIVCRCYNKNWPTPSASPAWVRWPACCAHEINQPLGAIVSIAQTAAEYSRKSQLESHVFGEMFDKIASQAMVAGRITGRIKSFLSKNSPPKNFVNVNELLSDAVAVLCNDAAIHFTRIDLDLDGRPMGVFGDRIQLQQVLVNLVRNAVDSMANTPKERRLVRVFTRAHDGNAIFVVSDRGQAASDETIHRMFEPYFTTKRSGLGVGLSISRQIIAEHGGRIDVRRNIDEGMTFEVHLPIAEENAASPSERASEDVHSVGRA